MIRPFVALMFLFQILSVVFIGFAVYTVVTDPAGTGEGVGRFLGSIVSGFSEAAGGGAR